MISRLMLERVLCVVDRSLRKEFPDDFHKRCLYAAFGVHALLRDRGYSPNIVGGDFSAFVVSRDGMQASMQGYSSRGASSEPSHYWTELDGSIIDLGPSYLPYESRYPALSMPVACWEMSHRLPKALQYHPEVWHGVEAELDPASPAAIRKEKFVEQCRQRDKSPMVNPKLNSWLLRSMVSIEDSAKRGDRWAAGAIRFEQMAQ